MRARSAALLADAARQLTARQALHRPRRLVPPRLLAGAAPPPGEFAPLAGGLAVDTAPQSGPLPPPAEDRVFRAFGRSRSADDPGLWTRTDDGLLFLFHLHGFSELAPGGAFWVEMVERWLSECGQPALPAWHPYPLSGRVMAWCAALSSGGWPEPLAGAMVRSLCWQLKFLRRSVEDDIGGNHVLRNACALVIGGACCGEEKARRRGLAVLERELPRQVLADGGHEERSPSYARAVLGDLEGVAEVERRAGRSAPEPVEAAIWRMRAALAALAGPDGSLPRLNDAWDGPLVGSDGAAVSNLADTGYVVLREGGDQAVLDVGPLCPPHLPPHAHADALSFVLWADGRPVVTDPGSGGYEPEDRDWARATRSHSTVEVDGEDQCVFWGPFRASMLPNVARGPLVLRDGYTLLSASHDGYRRLGDPAVHERTFCWLPGDGLVVVDRLRARTAHDVLLTLPLAPSGRGPLRIESLTGAPVTEREGVVARYFGVREAAPVLEQRARVAPLECFGWVLTRSEARVEIDRETVTVERPGRDPVTFRLAGR
ncbi:MAG: hypothetical protein QOC77_2406 [Thermoleophilaceae bacterium]|nr:hypothetical protein [Thermoleophilaceae bacterium]